MSYDLIDNHSVRLDSGELVTVEYEAQRLIGNAVMVRCVATCEGIKCEARHTVASALAAKHGVQPWLHEMLLRVLEEPPIIAEAAIDEHVRAAHSIRQALRIERELAAL